MLRKVLNGGSKDPFWDETAKMLIKAAIYYVKSKLPDEENHISSCLNIIRQGGADRDALRKLFIDGLPQGHPGRVEYENFSTAADQTMQSIVVSAISKISTFDTPAMQKITTADDFDFSILGRKRSAIYVITSTADSTYDFVSTIFFTQMLQRLFADADENAGTLRNQVYFLLDEFPNIGQIPDFHKKLSVTRSMGISMSICVQALDQLESLYKEQYETILGNCDTHLFLGSQSLKTCEYFSKSMGQKTIKVESKSYSKDKNEKEKTGVSISYQRQARELMTVDELKRLAFEDEIILIRGLKPIKAKKAWYYKYHPMRNKARETEIHNVNDMPKTPNTDIKIFDVQGFLNDYSQKAKEMLNYHMVEESGQESKSEFDLQLELEKKFDELFGTD